MGRLEPSTAEAAQVGVALVVGEHQDDVRQGVPDRLRARRRTCLQAILADKPFCELEDP